MRTRPGSNPSSEMGTPSAPGTRSAPVQARIEGVGEPLPVGEALLWEGRPDVRLLALRVFHLRLLLVYWGVVAAGFVAWGLAAGRGGGALAADLAWLALVGLVGTGVIFALARAVRRSTTYALTDRRVVIRMGIAFPSVLNLPLRQLDAVDLRSLGNDAGEVVLTTAGDARIGWLYLWPHARPWHFREPAPSLRALRGAEAVGRRIAAEVARVRGAEAAPTPEARP
jgi:hypothetical protein